MTEPIPQTHPLRAIFSSDGETATCEHNVDAFVVVTKKGPIAVRGDANGDLTLMKDGKMLYSTAPNELDDMLIEDPDAPVPVLKDVLNGMSPDLIRTGYWRPIPYVLNDDITLGDDAGWEYLPDVRELVDTLDHESATNIVRWLVENGENLQELGGAPEWDGFHTCRFEDCPSGQCLGGNDFTNGTYVWPESLIHYVGVHRVAPMELVEYFQSLQRR